MMMKRIVGGLVLALASAGSAMGAVYVDVETETGTFTIEMDAGARNGGTAFLGLAEGWADWIDPRDGEPKHGEQYYEGTSMGWVYKDDGGREILVGNLGRRFTDGNGGLNRNNGAGVEFLDDVAGPTGLVARSVAMVLQDGPHTLDGRWGVMLQDADEWFGGSWSRIGTVVSNWGVVESIAGRAADENGWLENPVEVTGMRVHGDAAEIERWRAEAQGSLPATMRIEVRLTGTGMRWAIPGTCRFKTMTTEKLGGDWTELDCWNEQGAIDAGWNELGLTGKTGFACASFPAIDYPELGGPTVTGKYSFRVEWEMGGTNENQVYHYDLDVGADTGMAYQLDAETQSRVLRSAALDQIIVARGGAHSTMVSFIVGAWMQVPYYWLGEREAGDGPGRFRMWEYITDGTVWGSWAGRGE